MAFYMDEEQVWKCPKHPSKRRRSGICPKCLRDRLVTLCPDCATARPCACCPPPVDASSSSSSSTSFSLFSFSRGGSRHDFATSSAIANGEACRLRNQLETDPALRRSRSSAIPFLRSRSKYVGGGDGGCKHVAVVESDKAVPKDSRSKINFWSVFTPNRSKKCDVHGDGMDDESNRSDETSTAAVDDYSTMMMRSRSVAVGSVAGNGLAPAALKPKGWYFPSPIKAFRHSKPPRSVAVA